MDTPLGEQYYHYASLGTTANLSDANGEAQVAYRSDAFGKITRQEGESVNRQVFTGQEHDEKTGLIYFGARFYDPDTARFINQDTYLGESNTPPSLNRYLYALSSPAVYVDRDGHVAGLDETGQYLMDTSQRLLDNVDEDSGALETAFYGFTAGANMFLGGVVETVNFGLNIAAMNMDNHVGERARSEMDEAFGTIQSLTENKAAVASNMIHTAGRTIGEAAAGNSKARANLIAFGTGALGAKGQNSILSANRTAGVVSTTKAVSTAVKNSRVAVAATTTVERALTAGGNRIVATSQSAVEGIKQATRTVREVSRKARVVPNNHIGAAWDAPTTTRWNPSAKGENCIACVSSYTTDRLDGKAGQFLTADDIERVYASVDPSRGLQLNEAVEIIHKASKSNTAPVVRSPFIDGAPEGQYAVFLGPKKDQLRHVVHTEVLPNNGGYKIFDPQNGQQIGLDDLMSLRIKWGGNANSPVVPVLLRGSE